MMLCDGFMSSIRFVLQLCIGWIPVTSLVIVSVTLEYVNIVLTADFSWSYTAFVGWVGSTCTLPWVELGWDCSSVGLVK